MRDRQSEVMFIELQDKQSEAELSEVRPFREDRP